MHHSDANRGSMFPLRSFPDSELVAERVPQGLGCFRGSRKKKRVWGLIVSMFTRVDHFHTFLVFNSADFWFAGTKLRSRGSTDKRGGREGGGITLCQCFVSSDSLFSGFERAMVSSASSSALVLCLACILFAPQLHGVAGEDGDGEGRGDVGANRWDDSDKHYQEFIRRGTRCMSFLSVCASFSQPFLPVPPPSPHSFLPSIHPRFLPSSPPPSRPPSPSFLSNPFLLCSCLRPLHSLPSPLFIPFPLLLILWM